MDTIEKIQRYIDRTEVHAPGYGMYLGETMALVHQAATEPTEAICLAFSYGAAKGYRAAKAEAKKERLGCVNVVKRGGVSFTDPANNVGQMSLSLTESEARA